jgi:predicted RNase H-like HicB family nuclease
MPLPYRLIKNLGNLTVTLYDLGSCLDSLYGCTTIASYSVRPPENNSQEYTIWENIDFPASEFNKITFGSTLEEAMQRAYKLALLHYKGYYKSYPLKIKIVGSLPNKSDKPIDKAKEDIKEEQASRNSEGSKPLQKESQFRQKLLIKNKNFLHT